MIIITGMLFLLTLPFFIYWVGKETPLKKHVVIILETIAIGTLIFSSVLVLLDISYIIKGGQLYEGEPLFISSRSKGTITLSNGEDEYWMEVMFGKDHTEGDVYVLPHTGLVYKIETYDIIDLLVGDKGYHIMQFGVMSLTFLVFAIIFGSIAIKAWYKWS
ncbi:MAG: hypothetical protein IJ435_03385 [Clostridia bacterium]|nr:hypothetical protein [Clostridia bacterium]